MAAIEENLPSPESAAICRSWQRSAAIHRVDPASREAPHILTDGALRQTREPIETAVLAAQPELDRLHQIVSDAGYVTLFTDANGIAVDCRGNQKRAEQFRYWGTWLGGVWSESREGTNGIGTCIAESRPITVHQSQHFRTRHCGLSCSGAPVFDPDAHLIGVVDVSSIDPRLSAQSHALTLPLVIDSAQSIEERLFRERFRTEWIIVFAPHGTQPAALLAVNREHRVIGADRCARTRFNLDQNALAGTSVWSLFERRTALLQRGMRRDYPVRLTTLRGGEPLFALVSTPLVGRRCSRLDSTLATQPRRAMLKSLKRHGLVEAPRGGLQPRALRRVHEYIAAHLGDDLSVETLARQAGLSVYHFARAFKSSVGMPPHFYVLERRVRKAAEVLEHTDLPVTDIALAVGFADHSHLSRSFHGLVGLTPSQYRRAHQDTASPVKAHLNDAS